MRAFIEIIYTIGLMALYVIAAYGLAIGSEEADMITLLALLALIPAILYELERSETKDI